MDSERDYTEKMLKDGSTLRYLKQRYLSKKTAEQRDWLLGCIRDSEMIVPCLPVSGKPDFLKDDEGNKYLPVFSVEEELPRDYADEFDLERKEIGELIDMAKEDEDAKGLVLDPFGTEPFMIEFDLAQVIMKAPSRKHPAK